MQYILFIILATIVILIFNLSSKAMVIAKSVDELDALKTHIFSILKKRREYILDNYDSLESHEFYEEVSKQLKLNERLALEFSFDVDDESNDFLKEAKEAIEEYNSAVEKHEELLKAHPFINKCFKYVNYKKL